MKDGSWDIKKKKKKKTMSCSVENLWPDSERGPICLGGEMGPFFRLQSNTSQLGCVFGFFSPSHTCFNLMGSRQTCQTAAREVFEAFLYIFCMLALSGAMMMNCPFGPDFIFINA